MRIWVALLGFMLSLTACAQEAPDQYVEGKHYIVLDQPVRPADPSKIEVAEVFSYHCPHCFQFEPMLQAWEKRQAPDVKLVQTHAMWNPQMEPMARAFYTINALKIKEKAHNSIFNAIHIEHKQFNSPEEWAEFISTFGVDKEKVLSTFNSFGVSSQIKQAEARARGYKITGTPEMVVEGKYLISSRLTKTHEDMLKVVDFLVAKARAERAKAGTAQ